MRTAPLAVALLILSGCVSAWGATSEPQRPDDFAFVPVVPSGLHGTLASSALGPDGAGLNRDEPLAQRPLVDDFLLVPWMRGHAPDGRPVVRVPSPRLIVVGVDGGRAQDRQGASHRSVQGVASWYCGHGSACTRGYPGGLYAAAGPALRTGDWRGRHVVVSVLGRSVSVVLIDWCACPHGRLLDLYSDAFSRLAPLSRGVIEVTVSWK